ncbi:dihydroxyacetone kinase transcriptional activator DhaS [Latilactobacillus sp. 5-91]|uniref:dihydroxyacetone kinase transcriptional activator DhaS n=1 Tax=Latilactobacillus sp. 5-91 TaxID=3410924 RepID=UPI003C78F45A
MSVVIQKEIATAFKTLMVDTPFKQISVTLIMRTAGIRRQTFYDYFPDKYALLTWIYDQEIGEYVADHLTYPHWTIILEQLLTYFEDNRTFYQNAITIDGQNSFETHFKHHLRQLVQIIIDDLTQLHHLTLSPTYQQFLLDYLSGAIVAYTASWLRTDQPQSIRQVSAALQITLTDTINGLLLRTGHLNTKKEYEAGQ